MMALIFFLQAHWGQALAILAAAATVLGTVRNLLTHLGWISPGTDSKLAKIADILSLIAEKGKTGLVGLLSLPGVSSKKIEEPTAAPKAPGALLALLAAGALFGSGCAHGTDGLRQACSNTDVVLTSTIGFTTATMHGDLKALRSQLPALGVAARIRAHEAAFGKALSLFDSMQSTKQGVCALAPAIDAGMKADVAALTAQVIAIAADAEQAYEALEATLGAAPVAK